ASDGGLGRPRSLTVSNRTPRGPGRRSTCRCSLLTASDGWSRAVTCKRRDTTRRLLRARLRSPGWDAARAPPLERSRADNSGASTSPGRPSGASHHDDETGVTSMIRLQILPTAESPEEEPSMRVVEWILALVAMIVAGVLAFAR